MMTFFAIVLLIPTDIFACACCAEYGHYSISYSKPQSFDLGEMQKLRFSTAELYQTAGGEDDIKGLNPIGETYRINGALEGNVWKLNFTDDKDKTGLLELPLPVKIIDFKVDIHDGQDGGAGSPLLYKEWRFKYNVKSASGIFQNRTKDKLEYFLVLQGRGNLCTAAENFTNWRLEVTGRKTNFAFFGKLSAVEPPETF